MAQDFRASQFRGAKFIASGSSAGSAKLVFYDISADSTVTPNQGTIDTTKFNTSSIGVDVFMYVSGTITSGSSTSRLTVFGGSVKTSGSFGFNNSTYIQAENNDLKFYDAINPEGYSLSQLASSSGGGGGGTLQEAYLTGSTITSNALTGSVSIIGNPGTTSSSLRLAPSNSEERAISVYNAANDTDLILVHGLDSQFGGAGIILRSQGSLQGYIGWQDGTSPLVAGESVSDASVHYYDLIDTLILKNNNAGGKIALWNRSADQAFLETINGTNGSAYFFPNQSAASLHNSGTFIQSGSATFNNGLSGSLTKLKDGSSYLIAGPGITIATASNGSIAISGSVTTPVYWYSPSNTVVATSGSMQVTGSALFKSTMIVTGAAQFGGGLSGSHTKLANGTSFILAGPNVSVVTNSNGAIAISGTMPNYWYSPSAGTVATSGSMQVTGSSLFKGKVTVSGAANSVLMAMNTGGSDRLEFYTDKIGGGTDIRIQPNEVGILSSSGWNIHMEAGVSSGGGVGGSVTILAASGANPGDVTIRAGDSFEEAGNGGNVTIRAGRRFFESEGNRYGSVDIEGSDINITGQPGIGEFGSELNMSANLVTLDGAIGIESSGEHRHNGNKTITGSLRVNESDTATAQTGEFYLGNSVRYSTSADPGTTTANLWTLTLTSGSVVDIDTTIIATGPSPSETKRFKRSLVAVTSGSTVSIMENSVFAPVLDVSGSSSASGWDVGFTTSGINLITTVTGSTTTRWTIRADYTIGYNT